MSVRIGNTVIKNGLFLAPMAGVSDFAFRKTCKQSGAEWIVSEMISSKALIYDQLSKSDSFVSKSAPLARIKAEELPMSLQIFGKEPEFMAKAARLLINGMYKQCKSEVKPTAIDINMGCPVHKVVSNGEGSALMKNPVLAGEIVSAVVKAADSIPVTVKIRAGWDSEHINAVEIAKIAEDCGASAVFVHARTREQMYRPGIDLSIISDVKSALKIPVIGNGDINSANDAMKMLKVTGCDGIMIARGATGNPWLFSEIIAKINGDQYIKPSFHEIVDMAKKQVDIMIEDKGERIASTDCKKHMAWYIKDIRNAASVRDRIMNTHSTAELFDVLDSILEEEDV